MLQRLSSSLIKHGGALLSSLLDAIMLRGSIAEDYDEVGKVNDLDGFLFKNEKLYLTKDGRSYVRSSNSKVVVLPSWLADGRDVTNSIKAIHSAGLISDLGGMAFKVSSSTFSGSIQNGTLEPIDAVSQLGSFITILGNNIRFTNVKVDMLGGKATRVVHVKQGCSDVIIERCEVCNVKQSRFTVGIFIDAKSVSEAKVIGCHVHHLNVVPNQQQGDADGTCRGILVGSAIDPVPTADTVSSVLIKDVVVEHMTPFEDCDAVVVQVYDADGQTLEAPNVRVIGVTTYNVCKRGVKVQANGVVVSDVNVYCDDISSRPMYAAVSLYGDGNSASNVYAAGRIENGVDTSYGLNTVSNVTLRCTSRVEMCAALHVTGGQVNATNINGEGADYIVLLRAQLANLPYANISGINGQGNLGSVLFEMRNNKEKFIIGTVHLSDISVASSNANASSMRVDITTGGTIRYIGIEGVKRMSQVSNSADINISGGVIECSVSDARFSEGNSTVGVTMTQGKLLVDNIRGNKPVNVQAIETQNSRVFNVEGVVRLRDTTNTYVSTLAGLTLQGTNTGLRQASWTTS